MLTRAVIIGCGRIAGGYNQEDEREPLTHVVAYRQAGVLVAGCCDRDGDRAERFAARWGIETWGTGVDNVLGRARPDIVSICTPQDGRLPIVEAVVRSSARALLIEKPLAARTEEARRIVACVRAWGRPALVNYLRAFDPWYRRLEAQVRSGHFGDMREIVGRYYGPAATNAAHLLERILALCGVPASVHRLSGSEQAPLFELRWPDGLVARLLPTMGCIWSPFELDLLFESGRVRVIESEDRSEQFEAASHPRYREFVTLRPAAEGRQDSLAVGPMNHVILETILASGSAAQTNQILERAVEVTRIIEEIGC